VISGIANDATTRAVDQVVARAQALSRRLVADKAGASVEDFLADRAREAASECIVASLDSRGHRNTVPHMPDRADKLLYSVADACRALGISRTTLYQLRKDGRLVSRKLGRRTVILAADLQAFLATLPTQSNAPEER
jgi:excisionase family DNA binding protein